MEATKRLPPILVAAFPPTRSLTGTLEALEGLGIGRDFIGVRLGGDGIAADKAGMEWGHLVSVLSPRRLHEPVRMALLSSGALTVWEQSEVPSLNGALPHPGTLEDRDLKLPLGSEYGTARRG